LAFGLSAWKQLGSERWALRCNPSSGNLHPTEVYLLSTNASILQPGVYHYVSLDHCLEQRCQFTADIPGSELYIGLSSIHWREAWKYGERAFRYCQHDTGHALAALSYAAACLGWTIELCSQLADSDIANWLGLDRVDDFIKNEQEQADLICRIKSNHEPEAVVDFSALAKSIAEAKWFGKAEKLSTRHFYQWHIIDTVAKHALKPTTPVENWQAPVFRLPEPGHNIPATSLIRQRRSAQRFNGKASAMSLTDFYRIMMATLPNAKPPFTAWNWKPQVHLCLFVHRVKGLEPGLYALLRDSEDLKELQQKLSPDFLWQKLDAPFDLYLLQTADVKQIARELSCFQPIASDSAFSLAMLSRFAQNIQTSPWSYRHLFWECGLIGQILYLEAEAAGVRGTGIGCFFDDAVHGVLGLQDNSWQSLYHFTIGTPLEDSRLQSLPAYGHLSR
jgi:SagB-type dehydrogenase family enzyme